MQGRAHVVENLNAVDTQFVDYSSVREIWKKEIEASEFELQERKEEESEAAKAAAANITRIDEEKFTQMEEESCVCLQQTNKQTQTYYSDRGSVYWLSLFFLISHIILVK